MVESGKSKEIVLDRIKRAHVTIPPEPSIERHGKPDVGGKSSNGDLKAISQRFLEMLQVAGGEGHLLVDEGTMKKKLQTLLKEFSGQSVLISSDPELQKLKISDHIEKAGGKVLHQSEVSLKRAADAGLGITTTQAGIADTGTVVIFHTSKTGRLAALLPPVHLVLLKKSSIFQDKIDYIANCRANEIDLGSTPISWITGPSLTADIEKVLVRGAHGPRRVIVILY